MSITAEDNLFPPGEFIRDELDARNWTQEDLAAILNRPLPTVNQIILAKKRITSQTAQELAAAFGTSAELWLNLEASYRLASERQSQAPVARRAKLYELGPVKDMLKRRWIEKCDTIDALETEVCAFFEINSVNEDPRIAAAARKSTDYTESTPAQRAWLFRAKKLAQACTAAKYSKEAMEKRLEQLHALTASEQEVRRVPEVLAQMGIRFVVVEHLPRTKLDGAAFWLSSDSPVIVLSLRYDRIDWFWHTLIHELRHIFHRDGTRIDNDLVSSPRTTKEKEMRADREASDFLIPHEVLDSFIARVKPRFSKQRIIKFANLHSIHPGIVVGQLQYQGAIKYSHSREMLVGVRNIITEAALTDGWGVSAGI